MNTRLGLLVLALLGFLMSGCGLSEQAKAEREAAEAELKQMEGKWQIASREGTGDDDDMKPDQDLMIYFVIENGILREELKGTDGKPEIQSRRKLVLMPAKTPKAVDLIYVDENGKEMKERVTKKNFRGKKKASTTTPKDVGVYKLEGNKLEMCISTDEKNRPTDFTAPAKSSRYMLKLEKAGAAEAKDEKDKDKKDKDKDKKDGKDNE
jgi:uncharacterized protein (TIGR03067 family)